MDFSFLKKYYCEINDNNYKIDMKIYGLKCLGKIMAYLMSSFLSLCD